ncbi:MAG: hypothetical protein AAF682_03945 [Planctomycetota bacterium]
MRSATLLLCVSIGLASRAQAATLTVGPPGSGAQFDQIQSAVDAAQPGDVILVQPGSYAKVTVDKPLRILGDGSGPVVIGASLANGVVVEDIAAGQELVLSGVEVQATPAGLPEPASVLVRDCAGTVVLHDLLVDFPGSQVGVQVEDCARAVLLACRVLDGGAVDVVPTTGAVTVRDSELWLADSELVGLSPAFFSVAPGNHGLRLSGSTARVWRSTLRGGDASNGKPGLDFGVGGAGVHASDSVLTLYGGPVGELQGGDGVQTGLFGFNFPGGAGVDLLDGSSARVQQDIPIAGGVDGAGAAQAPGVQVDGGSSFQLEPAVFPTLASDVQQVATGGLITMTLAGNAGGIQLLFLSFGSGPTISIPGVEGQTFLDPLQFLLLTTTVLPAGQIGVPLPVPASSALLGQTLFLQAAESFGAGIAISNPDLVTVTL